MLLTASSNVMTPLPASASYSLLRILAPKTFWAYGWIICPVDEVYQISLLGCVWAMAAIVQQKTTANTNIFFILMTIIQFSGMQRYNFFVSSDCGGFVPDACWQEAVLPKAQFPTAVTSLLVSALTPIIYYRFMSDSCS